MNKFVSGVELADRIEAFLAERPDIAPSKFKYAVTGRRSLKEMREAKRVKPRTIAKVDSLIADPPETVFVAYRVPRALIDPARVAAIQVKRTGSVRKRLVAKAQARIDAGVPVGMDAGVAVRVVQLQLERQHREEHRRADPVERAKLRLQRIYRPVVSEAVYGGKKTLFRVGHRKNVTKAELLELAERSAA